MLTAASRSVYAEVQRSAALRVCSAACCGHVARLNAGRIVWQMFLLRALRWISSESAELKIDFGPSCVDGRTSVRRHSKPLPQ